MPAEVDRRINAVGALFGGIPAPARADAPKTVAEAWNALAAKFPDVYSFAVVNKATRDYERMLCELLEVGREALAVRFQERLSGDNSETLEAALKAWWKQESKEG